MEDLSPDRVLVTKTANVALSLDISIDIAAISPKVHWVGGKISLFPEQLMFAPNRIDAALLPATSVKHFGIELASISSVTVESRFGVKSIVIQLNETGPTVGVRCFGATKFAETLRSLAAEQRGREQATG